MNRLASTPGPTLGYRVVSTAAVLWLISSVDVSAQFAMPPATSAPSASTAPAPSGQNLISQSREAISRRDFQSAVGLYRQAAAAAQAATGQNAQALAADTAKLRSELIAVGIEAPLLALPPSAPKAPLQPLGNVTAQTLPAPVAGTIADRKREALRLVATGRAALDRNDPATALSLAKQATALQVPEQEFAPGEPRVWQLVLDAESAARRAGIDTGSTLPTSGVQQASAIETPAGSSPVQQAGGAMPGQPSPFGNIQQVQNLDVAPLGGASDGERLYREGLELLSTGNNDKARAKFVEAWKYEAQLDLATRQQLSDKLTLLQPTKLPAVGNEPTTAIQKAELESKQKTARLYSEVTKELTAAEQIRTEEPLDSLDKLETLRRRVEGSDVDEAAKQSLLAMVGRALSDQKRYVEANRAQIDLDLQNEAVRTDMANQAALESRVDDEVSSLVDNFNKLMQERRFPEAEVVAKQVAELKPGSEIATGLFHQSRMGTRLMMNEDIRNAKELGIVDSLLDIDRSAVMMDPNREYALPEAQSWNALSAMRLKGESTFRGSAAEQDIMRKIDTPVSVKYRNRPLGEVLQELSSMTGIPMVMDERALSALRVTADSPVTLQLSSSISLKSALNLILGSLDLTYVVENDVMNITSKEAKESKVYPRTYRVTDLVTPIPNFSTSYEDGLAGALQAAYRMADRRNDVQIMPVSVTDLGGGMAGGNTRMGSNMLGQFQPTGGGAYGSQPGPRGLGGGSMADFDSLIQLIQTTIRPDTWEALGGPSAISPYPQNLSLVVRTTSDVHDEIRDLLENLRRLQNLQITIEVRFITLSDAFFESIGVDFDMSFDDNNNTVRNDDNGPSVTIGIQNGGTPTTDFDIELNTNNAVTPSFGSPDLTSGSTIGFAILSDIQAFFFLRAAQGDSRTNVMQAPKVTLFDGQSAFISDINQRPFVTSITPVVGDFAVAQQPVIVVLNEGTQLNVQGVVSDDKRYVRLTLVPTFSQIGEVNTFTYEGRRRSSSSSQTRQDTNGDGVIDENDDSTDTEEDDIIEGTTVQQPTLASTQVSTTVSVPDGGTILLGGIKRLSEGRTERGTPMLSKIPYISRLFRNVAIGRSSNSLMLMVTPRIIIQEEEEIAQTGFETPQ